MLVRKGRLEEATVGRAGQGSGWKRPLRPPRFCEPRVETQAALPASRCL